MGKKLISYVTVHDDDHVGHTFAPGDDIPNWAVERITNPAVWGYGKAVETTEPAEPAALTVPPRGGPGSSAAAWRAYAVEATKVAGLSIDIPEDASKADIIEALTDAGIPVE